MNTKTPEPMKDSMASGKFADPLHALRRKVYLGVLCLGTVIGVINWAVNQFFGQPDDFQAIFLPLLSVTCLSLLILLWRVPRTQAGVELCMCAITTTSLLSQLAYGLYVGNRQIDTDAELAVLAAWFPLNHILYFMILDKHRAPLLALLSYVCMLVMLAPYTVEKMRLGSSFNELFVLLQLGTANPIYIILLLVLSNLKERYAEARTQIQVLSELAATDSLTGLPNRRHFNQVLVYEMGRAERYGQALTLIMFDLDHFKSVNDTYGHDVGDQVLREAARLVRRSVREMDLVARWGGEEFVILVPATNLIQARTLAENLCQRLAAHRFETTGALTISLGVTEHRRGDTAQAFLKRADEALYTAKAQGRNQVVINEGLLTVNVVK